MKNKSIKIRKTWNRHPAEKVKEDASEVLNACELCGLYKTNPDICKGCEYDEEIDQVGNA